MMKKISSLFIATIGAFIVSGCSLFGGVVDKVADTVDSYCTKEPYTARLLYREQINAALAPKGHSVEVTCNGDPVEE